MTLLLEIAANALNTACIGLAGRNSLHTWWTGIAGGAAFAFLFFLARLYADVTLQLFFIVTGFTGWWRWLRGGREGKPLPVTRVPLRHALGLAFGGMAVAAGYGWLLHRFTDAYAPFVDSLVLSFSVLGQFLLVGRRLENWPCWLFVNTLSVPLYASRGLYLTAALYAAYWANALVAWRHWRRLAARP